MRLPWLVSLKQVFYCLQDQCVLIQGVLTCWWVLVDGYVVTVLEFPGLSRKVKLSSTVPDLIELWVKH